MVKWMNFRRKKGKNGGAGADIIHTSSSTGNASPAPSPSTSSKNAARKVSTSVPNNTATAHCKSPDESSLPPATRQFRNSSSSSHTITTMTQSRQSRAHFSHHHSDFLGREQLGLASVDDSSRQDLMNLGDDDDAHPTLQKNDSFLLFEDETEALDGALHCRKNLQPDLPEEQQRQIEEEQEYAKENVNDNASPRAQHHRHQQHYQHQQHHQEATGSSPKSYPSSPRGFSGDPKSMSPAAYRTTRHSNTNAKGVSRNTSSRDLSEQKQKHNDRELLETSVSIQAKKSGPVHHHHHHPEKLDLQYENENENEQHSADQAQKYRDDLDDMLDDMLLADSPLSAGPPPSATPATGENKHRKHISDNQDHKHLSEIINNQDLWINCLRENNGNLSPLFTRGTTEQPPKNQDNPPSTPRLGASPKLKSPLGVAPVAALLKKNSPSGDDTIRASSTECVHKIEMMPGLAKAFHFATMSPANSHSPATTPRLGASPKFCSPTNLAVLLQQSRSQDESADESGNTNRIQSMMPGLPKAFQSQNNNADDQSQASESKLSYSPSCASSDLTSIAPTGIPGGSRHLASANSRPNLVVTLTQTMSSYDEEEEDDVSHDPLNMLAGTKMSRWPTWVPGQEEEEEGEKEDITPPPTEDVSPNQRSETRKRVVPASLLGLGSHSHDNSEQTVELESAMLQFSCVAGKDKLDFRTPTDLGSHDDDNSEHTVDLERAMLRYADSQALAEHDQDYPRSSLPKGAPWPDNSGLTIELENAMLRLSCASGNRHADAQVSPKFRHEDPLSPLSGEPASPIESHLETSKSNHAVNNVPQEIVSRLSPPRPHSKDRETNSQNESHLQKCKPNDEVSGVVVQETVSPQYPDQMDTLEEKDKLSSPLVVQTARHEETIRHHGSTGISPEKEMKIAFSEEPNTGPIVDSTVSTKSAENEVCDPQIELLQQTNTYESESSVSPIEISQSIAEAKEAVRFDVVRSFDGGDNATATSGHGDISDQVWSENDAFEKEDIYAGSASVCANSTAEISKSISDTEEALHFDVAKSFVTADKPETEKSTAAAVLESPDEDFRPIAETKDGGDVADKHEASFRLAVLELPDTTLWSIQETEDEADPKMISNATTKSKEALVTDLVKDCGRADADDKQEQVSLLPGGGSQVRSSRPDETTALNKTFSSSNLDNEWNKEQQKGDAWESFSTVAEEPTGALVKWGVTEEAQNKKESACDAFESSTWDGEEKKEELTKGADILSSLAVGVGAMTAETGKDNKIPLAPPGRNPPIDFDMRQEEGNSIFLSVSDLENDPYFWAFCVWNQKGLLGREKWSDLLPEPQAKINAPVHPRTPDRPYSGIGGSEESSDGEDEEETNIDLTRSPLIVQGVDATTEGYDFRKVKNKKPTPRDRKSMSSASRNDLKSTPSGRRKTFANIMQMWQHKSDEQPLSSFLTPSFSRISSPHAASEPSFPYLGGATKTSHSQKQPPESAEKGTASETDLKQESAKQTLNPDFEKGSAKQALEKLESLPETEVVGPAAMMGVLPAVKLPGEGSCSQGDKGETDQVATTQMVVPSMNPSETSELDHVKARRRSVSPLPAWPEKGKFSPTRPSVVPGKLNIEERMAFCKATSPKKHFRESRSPGKLRMELIKPVIALLSPTNAPRDEPPHSGFDLRQVNSIFREKTSSGLEATKGTQLQKGQNKSQAIRNESLVGDTPEQEKPGKNPSFADDGDWQSRSGDNADPSAAAVENPNTEKDTGFLVLPKRQPAQAFFPSRHTPDVLSEDRPSSYRSSVSNRRLSVDEQLQRPAHRPVDHKRQRESMSESDRRSSFVPQSLRSVESIDSRMKPFRPNLSPPRSVRDYKSVVRSYIAKAGDRMDQTVMEDNSQDTTERSFDTLSSGLYFRQHQRLQSGRKTVESSALVPRTRGIPSEISVQESLPVNLAWLGVPQSESCSRGTITPRNADGCAQSMDRIINAGCSFSASDSVCSDEDDEPCECVRGIFSGNDDAADFFLPKLGMACSCGKKQARLVDPDEPTSLKNILRPWQVRFLAGFGISRGDQLVKAHHRSAQALATSLRQYRRKHRMTSFRTKSCGTALQIWSRTAKTFVRSIRKQLVSGTDRLRPPNTLDILSAFLDKLHAEMQPGAVLPSPSGGPKDELRDNGF